MPTTSVVDAHKTGSLAKGSDKSFRISKYSHFFLAKDICFQPGLKHTLERQLFG